jgi:hypothetical protein
MTADVFQVWTTDTKNGWDSPGLRPRSGYPPSEERGVAHRGDTGEMGVGRDGRVIDLRLPTGREGGRRGGRGRESVGCTHDGVHKWYCAVRMRVERRRWCWATKAWCRASAGPVALSGGIGAVFSRLDPRVITLVILGVDRPSLLAPSTVFWRSSGRARLFRLFCERRRRSRPREPLTSPATSDREGCQGI